MSSRLDGRMILIIFLGAAVTCDWNRDDRALRMAEAVVAYRAGHEPADAHVLLRADYEQRGSNGFRNEDGARLAGEELQSSGRNPLWLLHRVGIRIPLHNYGDALSLWSASGL